MHGAGVRVQVAVEAVEAVLVVGSGRMERLQSGEEFECSHRRHRIAAAAASDSFAVAPLSSGGITPLPCPFGGRRKGGAGGRHKNCPVEVVRGMERGGGRR